jgi:hypothetical protein
MRQPRVQEFECLGIPLKANFFAHHDCARAARSVYRQSNSQNQEIRKHRSPTSRHAGFPLDEITLYFANKCDPFAKGRYVKLILHEENWLPLIRALDTFTAVPNAVGGRRAPAVH